MRQDSPERILLIRLSSIGDIVLTTPLIRALKNRFPDAEIDYLVKEKYAELLQHHLALAEVIRFPDRGGWRDLRDIRAQLLARRYTYILDLHKNQRSLILTHRQPAKAVMRIKKYAARRFLLVKAGINLYRTIVPVYRRYLLAAAFLGVEDDGRGTELFVPEAVRQDARRRLRRRGADEAMTIIALAPGAGFATKRWPVAYFAQVAQHLVAAGKICCVLGGPGDRALGEEIRRQVPACVNFAGELSLLQSAAVLQQARLLITNDSGLMHIAEAVGTPVLAIFGSTVRELGFYPWLQESRVLENCEVSCRPCSHIGRNECPKGHFLCMTTLRPEQVQQQVSDMLQRLAANATHRMQV